MAMTPKQDRNGVSGPDGTRNTAVPGPDFTADIRAAKAETEAAQARRKSADHLVRPADQGVVPYGDVVGGGS